MSESPGTRTIVLAAADLSFPVVFEMVGTTIIVQAWSEISLVVSGPAGQELRIGYGETGVSVFRDDDLRVEVFGPDGVTIEIPGF